MNGTHLCRPVIGASEAERPPGFTHGLRMTMIEAAVAMHMTQNTKPCSGGPTKERNSDGATLWRARAPAAGRAGEALSLLAHDSSELARTAKTDGIRHGYLYLALQLEQLAREIERRESDLA